MMNNPPLAYQHSGCPLQIGTDFELESRLLWYWLAHYRLLETRTRHLLRQIDADCQAVDYDARWLPEVPQLHLYALRLLFPAYPIEFFSARIGARLFQAAINPRASPHCLAHRTFHWLCLIQGREPEDAAPYVGLIISCGRMPIEQLPVLHNCHGEMRLQPFEKVLGLVDQRCPPHLWNSSATVDRWAEASPYQPSPQEDSTEHDDA